MMHGAEKSGLVIVAGKPANKADSETRVRKAATFPFSTFMSIRARTRARV
jgi:hypothetical protein